MMWISNKSDVPHRPNALRRNPQHVARELLPYVLMGEYLLESPVRLQRNKFHALLLPVILQEEAKRLRTNLRISCPYYVNCFEIKAWILEKQSFR